MRPSYLSCQMTKKHQKAAAARAWACRHKPKTIPPLPLAEFISKEPVDTVDDLALIIIDADQWESDCGYEGGVNKEVSDTEYQPGSSSDEGSLDAESLDDPSGDELERICRNNASFFQKLQNLQFQYYIPRSQPRKPKMNGWRYSRIEHWDIWSFKVFTMTKRERCLWLGSILEGGSDFVSFNNILVLQLLLNK